MPLPDVAILLHGAGSTPEAAARLLGPAVPDGVELVAPATRSGVDDAVLVLDRLVAGAEADGRRVVLVGGLSLGAHAAARWAAARQATCPRLLLAMPAWTGPPDSVAAATAASADEIARVGTGAVLERLLADPAVAGDWVVDELVRAWSGAEPEELAAELRAAAGSSAPTLDELGSIRADTVVVALADDPLHPEQVARVWAGAVPGAALAVVPRHAPAADRGALGRAAALADGAR